MPKKTYVCSTKHTRILTFSVYLQSISLCLVTVTVGDYHSPSRTTVDSVWPTDSDLENELEVRLQIIISLYSVFV